MVGSLPGQRRPPVRSSSIVGTRASLALAEWLVSCVAYLHRWNLLADSPHVRSLLPVSTVRLRVNLKVKFVFRIAWALPCNNVPRYSQTLGMQKMLRYGVFDLYLPKKSALHAPFERHLASHGCFTSCDPKSVRNATWLILPVVICLSQRLSHACVSMN